MEMRCPKCGSPLKKLFFKDVRVDFCADCKGFLLCLSDLNAVIDDFIAENDVPNATINLDKDVVGRYEIGEKSATCPKCSKEMGKLNYAYDSNIILDKCVDCGVVWVDGDEMMRLAVFRKGNPVLDRMGEAIAQNRGAALSERYEAFSAAKSPACSFVGLTPRIILPLKDDQKCASTPYSVFAILAVNIVVFIIQLLFQNGGDETYFRQFGLVPSEAFTSIHGACSFITSMFIHGGFLHLFGNMLFLFIFADNIEDRFGHVKFLLLYLFFGLCADSLHIALDPRSTLPAIGASGAISGVMGAYFILYPAAKVKTYVYGAIVDVPAFAYLGIWFLLQIVSAYLDSKEIGGGVAWFAHIGGFAAGALAGAALRYLESDDDSLEFEYGKHS
jgi:membrane associated rhomboid family serine protease/Zn ribbon nucleic-acid-binding protein